MAKRKHKNKVINPDAIPAEMMAALMNKLNRNGFKKRHLYYAAAKGYIEGEFVLVKEPEKVRMVFKTAD